MHKLLGVPTQLAYKKANLSLQDPTHLHSKFLYLNDCEQKHYTTGTLKMLYGTSARYIKCTHSLLILRKSDHETSDAPAQRVSPFG